MPLLTLSHLDSWFRTPAHWAVWADSREVLQVIQTLGGPLHTPMGKADPIANGNSLLVNLQKGDTFLGNPWRLAKVAAENMREQQIVVELLQEKGKVAELINPTVPLERCEFAPTPLTLAERLGKQKALKFFIGVWEPVTKVIGMTKETLVIEAKAGILPAGMCVSKGHSSLLETLIKKNTVTKKDLFRKDGHGRSCIHLAAKTGNKEVLRLVIQHGEFDTEQDLRAQDNEGWNVAHHAAAADSPQCLREAVELCRLNEEELSAVDVWGRTPAHIAVLPASSELSPATNVDKVLSTLYEAGAPLFLTMGPAKLQSGAFVMTRPDQPVGIMGGSQGFERLSILSDPASTAGSTGFRSTKSTKQQWQLAKIVDVDLRGLLVTYITKDTKQRKAYQPLDSCFFAPTPIVLAKQFGHEDAITALYDQLWSRLADWLDLDAGLVFEEACLGALPAGIAAAHASPKLLEALAPDRGLFFGPKELLRPDCCGRNAIHRAAQSGSAEMLNLVIKLSEATEEDLEARDLEGRHMLHYACASNKSECVKAARTHIAKSVDELNFGDHWHMTPAHIAVMADAAESLAALYQLGVNVNVQAAEIGREEQWENATILLPANYSGEVDEMTVKPGSASPAWQLGRVTHVSGDEVAVRCRSGQVEKSVKVGSCKLAPTPFDLAEKLGRQVALARLRDLPGGRAAGASPQKKHTTSMPSMPHSARPSTSSVGGLNSSRGSIARPSSKEGPGEARRQSASARGSMSRS